MTPFDQLLARARLVDEPYSPGDIDAAATRIAARAAHRLPPHRAVGQGQTHAGAEASPADDAREAAPDLRALCESAVADAEALTHLSRFLGSLPEPCGARVLGCILQLTGRQDAARFWWQYAAGAADQIATYCLYLQHLAHGEQTEARWWQQQTDVAPQPAPDGSHDDVATTLRLLRLLRAQWAEEDIPGLLARLPQAGAVFDYIPAALSYNGEVIDLPLPDADFTDHITTLTQLSTNHTTGEPGETASPALPARTLPPGHTRSSRTRAPSAQPTLSRPWHDSGSSFGHIQRTGDVTTVWRRELAWQMFFDHCHTCRDCDPDGIPCPLYTGTTPSTMIDEITTGSPPPVGMNRRPIRCTPTTAPT